jgi:YceI-like domain
MHTLGPQDGALLVHTGKGGAAAKAGHELTIEVTRWRGTIDAGGAITLSADPRSLRVVEGTGGMSPLGDEEKAGISQTIDEEVLTGRAIEFRSTHVEQSGTRLDVSGELELAGFKRGLDFALNVDEEGRITGSAFVKQTSWKMKPFSALFGTLKVADVVEVSIDARVPASVAMEALHG